MGVNLIEIDANIFECDGSFVSWRNFAYQYRVAQGNEKFEETLKIV